MKFAHRVSNSALPKVLPVHKEWILFTAGITTTAREFQKSLKEISYDHVSCLDSIEFKSIVLRLCLLRDAQQTQPSVAASRYHLSKHPVGHP